MAIEFGCPACGGNLRVDDSAAGQVVRCGSCMAMLRVPKDAPPPGDQPDSDPPAFPDSDRYSPSPRESRNRTLPRRPEGESENAARGTATPRKRRPRREPPPPQGRSPLFWIILVFGIMGVGGCMMCCGVAAFVHEDWHLIESKEGGFTVEVPGPPQPHMSVNGLKSDNSFKVEGARWVIRNEDFAVFYKEIDRGGRTDDQILAAAFKELEASGGLVNRGEHDEKLHVAGFPAREIEYWGPGRIGDFMIRVIVAGNRLYVLVAADPTGEILETTAEHFLDSFTITDPKILEQGGKGREEREAARALGREVGEVPMAVASTDAVRARVEADQRARARLEQRQVATLGNTLGGLPLEAASVEQQRACATELGRALGGTTPDAAAAARLKREQERVAAAAEKIGGLTLVTIAREQQAAAWAKQVRQTTLEAAKAIAAGVAAEFSKGKEP